MRLEKWFISNLDDSQRKIIVQSIDDDIIVSGAAGSGKTNLAIHRALQAKGKGTYAILILTIALKRMVAYGMDALGLDKERIAYEWAWKHRGFDLSGDVYWDKKDTIYLVNDMQVRKFKLDPNKKQDTFEPNKFGLDFADWVDQKYYDKFGRRHSWFVETSEPSSFDVNDTIHYELIPSGVLYKKIEPQIDYLIVDEAQDFNIVQYINLICPQKIKSLSLFGDTAQQIYNSGDTMETIASMLGYKRFSLKYNYRLPKTIAKVAQEIQDNTVDLLTDNKKDGGNSDFPNYPKPTLTRYDSKDDELAGIVRKIKAEDLDDVAILVPDLANVKEINEYLNKNGINTQVHYRDYDYHSHPYQRFKTINTLDFSNNDLPCILTYYAAKGSEFDNVFVPFMNNMNTCSRNQFYVACTRSSRNLYISYNGQKNDLLKKINSRHIDVR